VTDMRCHAHALSMSWSARELRLFRVFRFLVRFFFFFETRRASCERARLFLVSLIFGSLFFFETRRACERTLGFFSRVFRFLLFLYIKSWNNVWGCRLRGTDRIGSHSIQKLRSMLLVGVAVVMRGEEPRCCVWCCSCQCCCQCR
jgi:hypothetical protein